ncbi:IS30 family transposase [Parahaliea sp. F7430]|uniref:IS30 family transposase n=1 Tax=Sediminihaliea albiluteola TaxID=2758564 RepID=A0A7W2TXB3_9GAMM|nr:IS30 family transposase [Sediminihaliea albiluteola]MBA6411731.1 IS30 family transposase [Sediminihaliea albiluteola]MBA6411736.1 IS30 family transposase [Sediminihaliea albiluteola]MBA6412828.1 IS30 family transposase [Sediminihaliea albiluteola]MBA6413671.1 IS30 family transposase [Sediminihaliea albiluteola]
MRHYAQLTQEQRYQIYALMKAGHSQTEIASIVGVHKSTVSREMRRNRGLKGYRPKQAQQLALQRRQCKVQPRIAPGHWSRVEELLCEDWSPEQVSLWLAQEEQISISHEWIYQYILEDKRRGGQLHLRLRCQKPRRKRYGSYDRRGQIPNRVSIEKRPSIVSERARLGDWELDTIIGKHHKQAIVSLTERKSRLALISKVSSKEAEGVKDAVIELLGPLSAHVHTITSDNGKEFACHQIIAEALAADFYFAHPYASWERGLNENTNGLIRQYFPKGSDFTDITEQDIEHVMEKLNNRPRKCLGMKTPNQVFFGINPPVALAS